MVASDFSIIASSTCLRDISNKINLNTSTNDGTIPAELGPLKMLKDCILYSIQLIVKYGQRNTNYRGYPSISRHTPDCMKL